MIGSVTCRACGQPLDPAGTSPCPTCGATARTIEVTAHATASVHESALVQGYEANRSKKQGLFIRILSGVVPSVAHGFVRLHRLIDKRNNRYLEHVETLDGTTLHHCEEPLSEHRGHGSAKPR